MNYDIGGLPETVIPGSHASLPTVNKNERSLHMSINLSDYQLFISQFTQLSTSRKEVGKS